MKTVKVASRTPGLNVVSSNPRFRYFFEEKDVPLEIPESHAKKILKNSNFYISDEKAKKVRKAPQNKPEKERTPSGSRIKEGKII